jgi:tyrosine-protein kinase Etk/Wzc
MQNHISKEETENDFQLREILDQYISHWKWFVLGVAICVAIAFTYLRYAVPKYRASTTILIKDNKRGGALSDLAAFSDMGLGAGTKNIDNEIEILKSRTLVETTIKKLNLNISMLLKGKVINTELYNDRPINIKFINTNPKYNSIRLSAQFVSKGNNGFSIKGLDTDNHSATSFILKPKSIYKYGELIPTTYGDLIIEKNPIKETDLGSDDKEYLITINTVENVAQIYRVALTVAPVSKSSNVVEIAIVGPVIDKSEAFLDNLTKNYNEAAVNDKNAISENTSKFIAQRLALIAEELDGVEQNVESFKTSNKLTDIETEAKLFIDGSSEYNKKTVEIEIQMNLVNSMLGFIKKSTNSDLLPTNVVGDDGASESINSYNQLILDRNRILKSATVDNPTVIKVDQQISALRSNIQSGLERLQLNLKIQQRNLKSQEGLLDNKIEKIPSQERQFRVIARQQKVKEELYLYLLQKREETAISLAATEPNARVIDAAKGINAPVSPKPNVIYLAAILLGLLIPFSVIYLVDLLDTKIKSRLDLEGRTIIPFIGDVPTSETANEIMQAESRTSSAEALRIIRTNLEFMVSKVPEGIAKTIFLTSTFPKEGKTFVSVNLAATFALSGKKVLLVGMDIRNPRLDEYLTLPDRGFTNYLSSKDLNLEDLIIKQAGYEDFHILPAGVIPPNPAELLMSKKVDSFFEIIKKQYDYIIIDTAPVSLVTDTLLIAKHADTFIYVARANFLEKRMLDIPNSLYKDQKLPNMCILLNDTDSSKGYGYGYGYGVKVEKKPWYKKIFNL